MGGCKGEASKAILRALLTLGLAGLLAIGPFVLDGPNPETLAVASGPQRASPTAAFTITPTAGDTSTVFKVDASPSTDEEDPTPILEVRWDWEDDGLWDTSWSRSKTSEHRYDEAGTYAIRLQVRDREGLMATATKQVTVEGPTSPPPDSGSDAQVLSPPSSLQTWIFSGVYGLAVFFLALNYKASFQKDKKPRPLGFLFALIAGSAFVALIYFLQTVHDPADFVSEQAWLALFMAVMFAVLAMGMLSLARDSSLAAGFSVGFATVAVGFALWVFMNPFINPGATPVLPLGDFTQVISAAGVVTGALGFLKDFRGAKGKGAPPTEGPRGGPGGGAP